MPQPDRAQVVVVPPGEGSGYWAGAPSAVRSGSDIYLAYRLRRPVGDGRGYAIVIARSGRSRNGGRCPAMFENGSTSG